jgi:hypothetical protein
LEKFAKTFTRNLKVLSAFNTNMRFLLFRSVLTTKNNHTLSTLFNMAHVAKLDVSSASIKVFTSDGLAHSYFPSTDEESARYSKLRKDLEKVDGVVVVDSKDE